MKKLTKLSNNEATSFLNKYDQIIFYETRKRKPLPGIDLDDLQQMCREKLLENIHLYDKDKATEKTWVHYIVKNTLNSIRRKSLQRKKVNYIGDEPVYDIPISNTHVMVVEKHTPEDYLEVLQALQFLKKNLSPESFDLIKKELIPSLSKKINTEDTKFKKVKTKDDFTIWNVASGLPLNEIKILSQIAHVFTKYLGFERTQIASREKTIDLNY
jgi:hypothetical protein